MVGGETPPPFPVAWGVAQDGSPAGTEADDRSKTTDVTMEECPHNTATSCMTASNAGTNLITNRPAVLTMPPFIIAVCCEPDLLFERRPSSRR